MKRVQIWLLAVVLLGSVSSSSAMPVAGRPDRSCFFTENKGQWDERVLFKAEGAGGLTWFIERDGFTVLFSVPDTTAEPIPNPRSIGLPDDMRRFDMVDRYPNKAHALKCKFQNALPRRAGNFLPEQTSSATAASIEPSERLSWNNNYFLGNDESKWAPDCENFKRVVLKDVWEGVDVQWRGVGQAVEFDFVVEPGADASQIRVECFGLTGDLEATADGGELLLPTSLGVLRQALPEAYQIEPDGSLQEVKAEFKVEGDNSFGVALPEGHDSAKPLVVDPLVYSTYLGGSNNDRAYALSPDGAGGIVVAGSASNYDFPTTEGAYQRNSVGSGDGFITCLNGEGSALIYSTYLGGRTGWENAHALSPDGAGGVVVAGGTSSDDFPTTEGAYQRNFGGNNSDVYIAHLNAEGSALIYSTYLGGSGGFEGANALSPDGAGGVVVAGYTRSDDFPTTEGAYQRNFGGGDIDAFTTRLNGEGSALIYSTYLGGSDDDCAYALAPDGAGGVVVAGYTESNDFPTTEGVYQRNLGGYDDAFVTRLNADGSALIYSTYLGGSGDDCAYALSPDDEGGVVVVGFAGTNFPTTEGAYQRRGALGDAFIARLNADGSALIYSTFLGGSNGDWAYALYHDGAGGVVVAGHTESNDLPTTDDAYQRNFGDGHRDAFIARLNSEGSALIYSTYSGGSGDDCAYALTTDNAGGVVVAGYTYSDDFPITEGAFDESFNGDIDAFITRIDIGLPIPATLFGHVYDLAGGSPLSEASVSTSWGDSVVTDEDGYWHFDRIGFRVFDLTVSKAGYNDSTLTDFELAPEETLEVNFSLRHPDFSISNDQLGAELPVGESVDIPFNISNQGNGPLIWSADKRLLGDAGFDPWSLRQSLPVSQITNDERIEGVIFDGESYYCSGSNGDDPNFLYRLSREGVLLDSIRQPGFSRYGLKDLEWDGELIWGSDGDAVYGLSPDGNVVHAWQAPYFPTNNITLDPVEEVLWLGGTTTDIKAYDREGNYLDRTISRQGLRLYGFAWYGDDPDSSFLYALNIPGNDSAQVNKFNPLSGEMRFVHAFPLDSAASFNSAFICHNYDRYQGWVLMTVANITPAFGGDELRVYQLAPNREWFTIDRDSGEIPGGGESQIIVTLRTAGEDNDWAFALGEYEGEIVFTHNGFGGQTILPVRLSVVEPNDVDQDGYGDPSSFELFAAYPNPFNSSTTITFSVGQVSKPVKLAVYDLNGRLVAELVNGRLSAGRHTTVWDGASLAAGVYLIRLESEGRMAVSKGVIIK